MKIIDHCQLKAIDYISLVFYQCRSWRFGFVKVSHFVGDDESDLYTADKKLDRNCWVMDTANTDITQI